MRERFINLRLGQANARGVCSSFLGVEQVQQAAASVRELFAHCTQGLHRQRHAFAARRKHGGHVVFIGQRLRECAFHLHRDAAHLLGGFNGAVSRLGGARLVGASVIEAVAQDQRGGQVGAWCAFADHVAALGAHLEAYRRSLPLQREFEFLLGSAPRRFGAAHSRVLAHQWQRVGGDGLAVQRGQHRHLQ